MYVLRDRRLIGLFGGLGNWGILFTFVSIGGIGNPDVGLKYSLTFLTLGIIGLLMLLIGLYSIAVYYSVGDREKILKYTYITLGTYVTALILMFIGYRTESEGLQGFAAILDLVVIGLILYLKKEVYIYFDDNISKIFGILSRMYMRVANRFKNPYGNDVVIATPETHFWLHLVQWSIAFIAGLILWFTIEPIGWILWGFTGK